MAGGNPIKYTSYDFNAIMADLNSDPNLVDKEDWWKRVFAGIGDTIGMHQNAGMNNAYLRTCFTRRAALDLLALINFALTPQQTSSGNVILYIKNSAGFPFTLTGIGDMAAATQGSASSGSLRFETRLTSQVVTAFSETFTANSSTGQITTPGGRSYTTGEKVLVSNVGGSLPGGLAANTSYYVISVSNTPGTSAVFKLASSVANAYAGVSITLTSNGSGTNTVALYSVQVPMYQQTTVAQYSVGTGDGVTPWQQFNLNDVNVLSATLSVLINSVTWALVTNPVNNPGTTQVYRLFFNNDQSSYLEFGDNNYGAVASNFPIFVQYAWGGGSGSNVALPNIVNAYAGANANIEGCSNPAAMTGGADPMPLSTAKAQGPIVAAVQNRFITAADGVALMLAYGGISLAKVNADFYGPNSAQLLAIVTGGGGWGGALQTAVVNYLTPLTLMGSAFLVAATPTLTPITPSVSVHLNAGASWSQTQAWVSLACSLFFTERGAEFQSYFKANGVAAAVALLNTWGSYSFGPNDYSVATALLTNFTPRNFGDYLTLDQFTTYVEESVNLGSGANPIAYMTVSSPTFPVSEGGSSITTLGGAPTVAQI